MMLASVKYQTVCRNSDGSEYFRTLREESYSHYHYSLTHLCRLLSSRTLDDIVSCAMICCYLRSFPTPGACWMMTSWILTIAIEMGLHRTVDAWADSSVKQDSVQAEIRKRVFWTLLLIHVTVGCKLGRPMMLRREDFDVELPSPFVDSVPPGGQKSSQKSQMVPSNAMFEMLELCLDTFNTIYTIQPLADYEGIISRLEARAQEWTENMPPGLQLGTPENETPQNRIYALWMNNWAAEFHLVLHHPALCRSSNPEFIAQNTEKATQAAFRVIQSIQALRAAKMLDTTWINATTYIAAVFTLLFVYWERRDGITLQNLQDLRNDMEVCLEVMRDVGELLGKTWHLVSHLNCGHRLTLLLPQDPAANCNQQSAKSSKQAYRRSTGTSNETTWTSKRPPQSPSPT